MREDIDHIRISGDVSDLFVASGVVVGMERYNQITYRKLGNSARNLSIKQLPMQRSSLEISLHSSFYSAGPGSLSLKTARAQFRDEFSRNNNSSKN
jgi:hypothetical protein